MTLEEQLKNLTKTIESDPMDLLSTKEEFEKTMPEIDRKILEEVLSEDELILESNRQIYNDKSQS